MDIKKQLNKVNIKIKQDNKNFVFTFPNNTTKTVEIKKIEQYLFICLLEYIEN